MKKFTLFVAIAATLSLASCRKEELNGIVENNSSAAESPVFTAEISTEDNIEEKTTVDATSGKVSWETTDEITITDNAKNSAVYKIKSIDGTTGRAIFEYKSGSAIGAGPYTATYGTAPATSQTYSATPGKLYMTAQTSTNAFTFTVQCGMVEFKLTKSGISVKSIELTGTPTGGSQTTYTLTCSTAQGIGTQKSFYIAVPAGKYNKIVISDNDYKTCTLTAASGITVAANHIKPLTFDTKLNFLTIGALPGKFSVSDSKQVYFSSGNLVYDGSAFNFEADQYGFATNWNTKHVSHYYWHNKAATARTANYTTQTLDYNNFFTNASETTPKADFTVAGVTGKYRLLSKDEWTYLFGTNAKRKNLYKSLVTICDIPNCVVLLPDGWKWGGTVGSGWKTEYNETTNPKWSTMEAAGAVCLPAAGTRHWDKDQQKVVLGVGDKGRGFYWSSTRKSGDNKVYRVVFDNSSFNPPVTENEGNSTIASCVRLVVE